LNKLNIVIFQRTSGASTFTIAKLTALDISLFTLALAFACNSAAAFKKQTALCSGLLRAH
jgi:hypothetical protein